MLESAAKQRHSLGQILFEDLLNVRRKLLRSDIKPIPVDLEEVGETTEELGGGGYVTVLDL